MAGDPMHARRRQRGGRYRHGGARMTTPNLPNIPLQLAGRPTIGGLVVPWITGRTPDGRYRFGAVDLDRQNRALTDRLCQTCGANLGTRTVFAMRDSDLRLLISAEPGCCPAFRMPMNAALWMPTW
ncbi:hypothetical protein ABZ807_30870 [Micromonospora sp. NPDC047548]|uniref:hypothetical protein n=1 Tax=Micromonospora sp. NPDC047548 TaxID=3155624 RepID=UPI00340B94C1